MAEYDGWAKYYDLVHQGLPGEAEFYIGQAIRIGGRTLELGCGTGRIAIPMAMSGVDVTGLDTSRAMLDRCRLKRRAVGKLPGKLRLVQGDMREFHLPGVFDFIAMPYRTVMHLRTPADQRASFEAVRRHLAPDGTFILNCWVPRPSVIAPLLGAPNGLLQFAGRYGSVVTGREWLHFCSTICDEFQQALVEEHVFHELNARGRVVATESLRMERSWILPREMEHLAAASGYRVEACFGDFDCNPLGPTHSEMIWVLKGA